MHAKRSGAVLLLLLLIGGMVFATLSLADGPPRVTGWSDNPPTAASLVVGVPNEGSGAVTNAGIMQVIYGYADFDFPGNPPTNSEYMGQTSSTGGVNANDYFASALAVGDFNRDGYYDIAAGVPGEDNATGAVNIFYGSENGFVTENKDYFAFTDIDPDGGSNDDNFGAALTTGDFDGDGFTDLAVSAPGYDVSGTSVLTDAGTILFFWGSSNGLNENNNSQLYGDDPYAEYGFALAAADFDSDGKDDLVIGAPNNSTPAPISNPARGGMVYIIYYSDITMWHQTSVDGGNDGDEDGDRFGAALAVGDFNGDGYPDLAIGAPGEDLEGDPFSMTDTGAMSILYNDGTDLSATGAQFWWQSNVSETQTPHNASEASDQFGYALAAGDFNNDGFDDLAVGTPYEDLTVNNNGTDTTYANIGLVQLIPGATVGLTTTTHPDIDIDALNPGDNQYRGVALAAGDFDSDGKDDIAIGLTGYTANGHPSAGAIRTCYDIFWDEGVSGSTCFPSIVEASPASPGDYEHYGTSLAVLPAPLSHRVYLPLILR